MNSMNQKAFIGKDSIAKFKELLANYNPTRIFLVRGKKSYGTCGAKSIVEETMHTVGCEIIEFYDFEENPKLEDAERGLELMKENEPTLIVAVGGGSVIDMAKLIRFFHSYSGDATGSEFQKEKELLPLIALTTTAGAGAEATHFAVMYKDKVKYSVVHEDILPNYAVVYPPFTYNNPKYLTACTGFDALAQAIEAYWAIGAIAESDEYAVRAIKLLYPNLCEAVNNPNEEVRDKIAEGAYWAGRAINIAKTTAPHAFSYVFTTHYGYPHGHAVALTFPFFVEYNYGDENSCEVHRAKMNRLYATLGIDGVENARCAMAEYIESIGLTKREDEIDMELVLSNVNAERLSNNPVMVVRKTTQRII